MINALLPLKNLSAAKTRLASVFSPSDRRGLMRAMAEDVLGVISSHPGLDRVWLVSDDLGAEVLAERYLVHHVSERILGCCGLNTVLEAACERVVASPEDRILVLHADLPWLTRADIDVALAIHSETGGLLLAPDRGLKGTNLMVFQAENRPPFCFGENSNQRYQQWAQNENLACTNLQCKGTASDVDLPVDVAELLTSSDVGGATLAWLNQVGLRGRPKRAETSQRSCHAAPTSIARKRVHANE